MQEYTPLMDPTTDSESERLSLLREIDSIRSDLMRDDQDMSLISKKLSALASMAATLDNEDHAVESNSESFLSHMNLSTKDLLKKVAKSHDSSVSEEGAKRQSWFVGLLYPLIFLKSISWGISAVLLIVTSLTIANPDTDDGPIFFALIVVIIASSISDALDQRINVVTESKFRYDIFLFKYTIWLLLEMAQLAGAVLVGRFNSGGPSSNINALISYLALIDSVISIIRIILESIGFGLGPAKNFRYLPVTQWNDLFNV